MTTRNAGYNERRCISRDGHGLYGWVAVAAKYNTQEPLDEQHLRSVILAGLHQCLSAHGTLSAVVKLQTGSLPQIVQVNEVDLLQHLVWLPRSDQHTDEDRLSHVFKHLHKQPLVHDGLHPQWRLYALPLPGQEHRSSVLLAFAFSHVLLDGMSGYKFHASLLDALNKTDLNRAPEAIWTAPASAPYLPPALDQAVKLPISWSFLLRALLGELLPAGLSRLMGITSDSKAWHGAEARPSLPPSTALLSTKVLLSSVSSEQVSRLLSVCRQHDCKLTSLLNHLLARSLSEALQEQKQEHAEFRAEVPYDLRTNLPPSLDHMGNYPSAIELTVKVDMDDSLESDSFWKHVRADTNRIQQAATTLQDQVIALLQYLSNFDEWILKRATQPATASFSNSNLGSFSPEQSQHSVWQINETVFSQSADATGAPINVNVASCKGGKLWLVITWWPGMLGVDDEDRLIQLMCDGVVRDVVQLTPS